MLVCDQAGWQDCRVLSSLNPRGYAYKGSEFRVRVRLSQVCVTAITDQLILGAPVCMWTYLKKCLQKSAEKIHLQRLEIWAVRRSRDSAWLSGPGRLRELRLGSLCGSTIFGGWRGERWRINYHQVPVGHWVQHVSANMRSTVPTNRLTLRRDVSNQRRRCAPLSKLISHPCRILWLLRGCAPFVSTASLSHHPGSLMISVWWLVFVWTTG